MATTSISLTDPVSGNSVPIWPATGVSAKSLEVEPTIRVVAESRVLANGSYDTTAFMDEAPVILNLILYSGSQATFMDSIGSMLAPSARPYLVVTDDEWGESRQLTVRLDSMYKPRSDRTNWPVQINWMATEGVWEQAGTMTSAIVPVTLPSTTGLIITNTTGLHISATNHLDIPPTSAPGEFQASNPGNVISQWTAQLYGPAVGPKLANDTTGLTLEFTDSVSLNAGDFILLDSRSRSALLNGNASSPVIASLNFGTSSWWQMQPGTNTMRYYPTSGSAGAEAVVTWRPAWMT